MIQSSCGLHSYKVEPKVHHHQHFMGGGLGLFAAGESPSSTTDVDESGDDDDDPVFCSSPARDVGYLSEGASSPSSRGRTPDSLGEEPTLMDRLNELEQMMGSSVTEAL